MQYFAKYVILTAVVIAALIAVANSHYEARLWTGSGTYIIALDRAPIWSPPPLPDYAAFTSTFDNLPSFQPTGFTITRVHRWSWTLLGVALNFVPIALVTALVYFPLRERLRDPVLHLVGWIGIGLAGSAVLCILLWLISGGWGPPAPLFFAGLGIAACTVIAVTTCRSEPSRSLLHFAGDTHDEQ